MNDYLWQTYHRLINELDITTHRFLYDAFHVGQRLLGITGPRGVGKTTMMLQYIKEHLYTAGKTFYFSADNTYFNEVSMLEFVDELYQQHGVTCVFIDEIHKYSNWNQELKNIYDSYPKLKIVFSGSSSIDLIQGSYDLSRRAQLIHMPGLSFREYLNLTTGNNFSAVNLDDLLTRHVELAAEFSDVVAILKCFHNYKSFGYYPFILDDSEALYTTIQTMIEKTINEDIADFYRLKTSSLKHFKRILNFLATIPPGNVNPSNIARHLSIDYKTVDHYLDILSRTGLVRMLHPVASGSQTLTRPSKIYLDNATLLAALNTFLASDLEVGTQRELFFLQSTQSAGLKTFCPTLGDFKINDITFEIGGKNKTAQQLAAVKGRAVVVKDDILVGFSHNIPLYLFGFLY